jgi:hypothetical protein
MSLFFVLFEEWEAVQEAADTSWLEVWRKIERCSKGAGAAPNSSEIANAFLLRCEAAQLLEALKKQLRAERERVPVI